MCVLCAVRVCVACVRCVCAYGCARVYTNAHTYTHAHARTRVHELERATAKMQEWMGAEVRRRHANASSDRNETKFLDQQPRNKLFYCDMRVRWDS